MGICFESKTTRNNASFSTDPDCQGSTQITAVDAQGRNFISTVVRLLVINPLNACSHQFKHAGDLWYFPPGIPHSLQATDDDPAGSEFILVSDGAPSKNKSD